MKKFKLNYSIPGLTSATAMTITIEAKTLSEALEKAKSCLVKEAVFHDIKTD